MSSFLNRLNSLYKLCGAYMPMIISLLFTLLKRLISSSDYVGKAFDKVVEWAFSLTGWAKKKTDAPKQRIKEGIKKSEVYCETKAIVYKDLFDKKKKKEEPKE